LVAIALLFVGIEKIVSGIINKESREWSRAFSIGVGVIAHTISISIMVSPLFGVRLAGLIIGIALLIIGIEMIIAGISGRRQQLVPTSGSKA
jgi:uncharacterized membrane protein HdeD (DUF308 family)